MLPKLFRVTRLQTQLDPGTNLMGCKHASDGGDLPKKLYADHVVRLCQVGAESAEPIAPVLPQE